MSRIGQFILVISNRAQEAGLGRLLSIANHRALLPHGLFVESRRHMRSIRKRFRTQLDDQDLARPEALNELWTNKLNVYKSFMPVNQKSVLLEALFNAQNDIDALLRIIDENLESMTSFYIAVSFEVLDDMMRSGRCDINTVIVSPELKRLCSRTIYKIRFFESDEVLKLLKCLATIRLPEETLLSQAAFQMARHLINDYNLDELKTLSECLNSFAISDHSKKSLLLALKDAIPIATQNQIKSKHYNQLGVSESSVAKKD